MVVFGQSGKRVARHYQPAKTAKKKDYSKRLISDIRLLLWVVTLGGIFLAAYCIHKGYVGSLPWLSAMVGLPWTAHGTVCAFYLNISSTKMRTRWRFSTVGAISSITLIRPSVSSSLS